jgi:hypothetical protein
VLRGICACSNIDDEACIIVSSTIIVQSWKVFERGRIRKVERRERVIEKYIDGRGLIEEYRGGRGPYVFSSSRLCRPRGCITAAP